MNGNIIDQVLILFLAMAVGAYAKKKNYINKEIGKGLSELLINVTFPLLIISSFSMKFSKEMLNNSVKLLIYACIIDVLLIILNSFLYFKFSKDKSAVLRFSTVFSNCSFMGYPIMQGLFGDIGKFYASVFVISFNIFMFTYGIMVFTGERDLKSLKKAIINPNIISVIIGLIIFIFSIQLPEPISKTISMVGSMTTPLSMIIIGSSIMEMNLKEVFSDFSVYYGGVIRLILVPIISLLVLKMLGANDLLMKIIVVAEAMPTAATTAVFAEKYNGDLALASRSVFITTMFSIITIPLIISLI